MMGVTERFLLKERRLPLVIEPASESTRLADLLQNNRGEIEQKLVEHGALLFRGFRLQSVQDFELAVEGLGGQRLDYSFGSTPRTSVGNRIFTATEYPPALEIPLHNESSYQRVWPKKIAFCCLVPAASGGETPIADMQRVTAKIGAALVDKFEELRVRYVRHYRPYLDVPWQKVFQTSDKSEVARFCELQEISHEWLDDNTLRTVQTCQGAIIHPTTGVRTFFNQAHLFHVSALGQERAKSLLEVFGRDRLPRHSSFGNGVDIAEEELDSVRTAFASEATAFSWKNGDLLLLDNIRFAHGRWPFTGDRKVVAALIEPHSEVAATDRSMARTLL